MRKILTTLILVLLPLSATGQVFPRHVDGAVVMERAGDIHALEEEFLRELGERLIPLPDTIWVRRSTTGNATLRRGGIVLSKSRFKFPSEEEGDVPYLFGRTETEYPSLKGQAVHTLAHEVAHNLQIQMWGMRPRLPPPLWWGMDTGLRPFPIRVETEAELMAAALQQMVFGTSHKALGFPDTTWAGPTDSLVTEYEARIKDFHRIK